MSTSQRLGITFSFKYIDVLMLNLHYFFNNKLNIFLLLSSIILIILKIRKNFINKLKIISPILLILLMPFIWMFVCNNHSAVHYWMISRIFSISIFSLMMIALVLFNDSKYSELEKLNINDYFALICSLAFFIFYKFNIIIIILYVLVILIVKIDKKLKLFISLLLMISSLLLIGKSLNKNNFNNKEFFQNIYNELYDKAISYGLEYTKKNNIQNIDKVDIRDLIDTINADSVFLLSCKGYITIDNFSVKPYINCNDAIITEGYINN